MGNSFLTPKAPVPVPDPVQAEASAPKPLVAPHACSNPDHSESGHTLLCRFVANLKA